MFVNLRVGRRYICAEWTYDGLPAWLNHISNIVFRFHNESWENQMRRFILSIIKWYREPNISAHDCSARGKFSVKRLKAAPPPPTQKLILAPCGPIELKFVL